jgi:hypothetical protein
LSRLIVALTAAHKNDHVRGGAPLYSNFLRTNPMPDFPHLA